MRVNGGAESNINRRKEDLEWRRLEGIEEKEEW